MFALLLPIPGMPLMPEMPEAAAAAAAGGAPPAVLSALRVDRALAAGATGYLLKTTRQKDLIAGIRQIYEGGSPMSSNIARKVVQSFRRNATESGGVEDLTPREREVLQLLAAGDLYKEIADHLGITVFTVNAHVRRIYGKLQVRSRGQAVAKLAHLATPDTRLRPPSGHR